MFVVWQCHSCSIVDGLLWIDILFFLLNFNSHFKQYHTSGRISSLRRSLQRQSLYAIIIIKKNDIFFGKTLLLHSLDHKTCKCHMINLFGSYSLTKARQKIYPVCFEIGLSYHCHRNTPFAHPCCPPLNHVQEMCSVLSTLELSQQECWVTGSNTHGLVAVHCCGEKKSDNEGFRFIRVSFIWKKCHWN